MSQGPPGLDPTIQTREIAFEADVQSVTPFLKLATVSLNGTAHNDAYAPTSPTRGEVESAAAPEPPLLFQSE